MDSQPFRTRPRSAKKNPRARKVDAHLVVGEKGVELEQKMRRYKARMVAGGHRVKDARGRRIRELLNHVIPASLFSIRLVEAHACCFVDGIVLHGDVKNAYVKADLGGEEVWIVLPKRCRPRSHDR